MQNYCIKFVFNQAFASFSLLQNNKNNKGEISTLNLSNSLETTDDSRDKGKSRASEVGRPSIRFFFLSEFPHARANFKRRPRSTSQKPD